MQGRQPICTRSHCEKRKKLLHFVRAFTIIDTQDIDARQKRNTKCSTKVREKNYMYEFAAVSGLTGAAANCAGKGLI